MLSFEYFAPLITVLAMLSALAGCGHDDTSDAAVDALPDVADEQGLEDTAGDADGGTVVERPPNILLLIADDLGLDASSQYSLGTDLPSTPNLDALAADGVVFENAWATPACTTTRGTLITGKHGVTSGVDFVPAVLPAGTETIQQRLQDEGTGYASAVIGKWHLGGGNPPNDHPDEFGVPYYAGNIRGNLSDYEDWPLIENHIESQSDVYHTTKVTDLARDWIQEQNSPWFMWLAYVAPHSPFHLPPADLHNRDLTGTPADIDANRRDYFLAAIEAMDAEIGRLLASIPDEERENTIVVFMGDNGTPRPVIDRDVFIGAHGKSSLYEGGIRVPFIVSGEPVARKGEREDALVNTTDLFATVMELTGTNVNQVHQSVSFAGLLDQAGDGMREFNYSEFKSSDTTGWTVRDATYKLLHFQDGTEELYNVVTDIGELDNLLSAPTPQLEMVADTLRDYGLSIRGQEMSVDITGKILTDRSGNCEDYVSVSSSSATDVARNMMFSGSMKISVVGNKCVFETNVIPNHDFNDGARAFPNEVSPQQEVYEVTTTPMMAAQPTQLTLTDDNALLLNGVKVDLLAAGCFGVGNGRIGCNDINQPWRYDPMNPLSGFSVDTHNAHSQPNGAYHYHGPPNALFDDQNPIVSPVIGFASDGFPIFGSYFDDNGTVRKATSSFQVRAGARPSGAGSPGGDYDGTYRDDYEYVAGSGDLDQCNGMTINGVYGYYVTEAYPYLMACFRGTPDPSFNKRN